MTDDPDRKDNWVQMLDGFSEKELNYALDVLLTTDQKYWPKSADVYKLCCEYKRKVAISKILTDKARHVPGLPDEGIALIDKIAKTAKIEQLKQALNHIENKPAVKKHFDLYDYLTPSGERDYVLSLEKVPFGDFNDECRRRYYQKPTTTRHCYTTTVNQGVADSAGNVASFFTRTVFCKKESKGAIESTVGYYKDIYNK